MGQAKTLHIRLDTIPPSLPWTSSLPGSRFHLHTSLESVCIFLTLNMSRPPQSTPLNCQADQQQQQQRQHQSAEVQSVLVNESVIVLMFSLVACVKLGDRKGIGPVKIVPQQFPEVYFDDCSSWSIYIKWAD